MFMSDMAIIAWMYFKLKEVTSLTFLSKELEFMPNFQQELHIILLKSFYFLGMLFIVAQFFCYLCALKKMRASYLYLKFYAVMAFTVSLLIAVRYQSFALLPAIIYVLGYYQFAKLFKETAVVWQNQHQSPKQQSKKPLFF